MSGWLVVLIVAAAILVVVGIQISSRQIQQFPVDTRNPGPIVEATRTSRFIVRPAELENLYSIVGESLSSEGVARAKLHPLLHELRAEAPHDPASNDNATVEKPRSRRRRSRDHWLDRELTDLERRWGLDREV